MDLREDMSSLVLTSDSASRERSYSDGASIHRSHETALDLRQAVFCFVVYWVEVLM